MLISITRCVQATLHSFVNSPDPVLAPYTRIQKDNTAEVNSPGNAPAKQEFGKITGGPVAKGEPFRNPPLN